MIGKKYIYRNEFRSNSSKLYYMENMFLYQNLNNNQLHIQSSLLNFNKLNSFM